MANIYDPDLVALIKLLKGNGGGGGASALSDLSDVDLTTLANGQELTYNGSKWTNVGAVLTQTLTAGSTTLTFTNGAILSNSRISVFAPVWYSDIVASIGEVELTFPAQASDITVVVEVR